MTPAAVTATPLDSATSDLEAFLLVAPYASQPIQILPTYTGGTSAQLSVPSFFVVPLPPGGGPGTASFPVTAIAVDPSTGTYTPASVPFQFDFDTPSLPPFIEIDPAQGTTPATVNVTAQLDSIQPGKGELWYLYVTGGSYRDKLVVLDFTRPAPAPLVSPTTVSLTAYLGQPPVTAALQVTPPDNTTSFQVQSLPAGLTVAPSSGAGPTTLTLSADPSQFSLGTSNVIFAIQVGTTTVSISVSVSLNQLESYVYVPADISPGLRATISVFGVAANLPTTGSWTDASPAPTSWNGYTFVYRSYTLPILSANPSTLQFDIQLPYDLDLTGQHQPVNFVAPDGTVVSSASTYGVEQPTAIAFFNSGSTYNTVLKSDGSAVSSANPVAPGDTIHFPIVGAGVTNPPIIAGLLPPANTTVSPTAAIQVAIGGVTATVAQQVLDSQWIGVTDLYIEVPNVASGLEMVGLQSGGIRVDLIPIWVLGREGQVSQTIAFGAPTNEPLGTPPMVLGASASSGLPVSFSSLTGAVCTVSGATVSLIAIGACTIQATQAGNATYLAAPSVTQSFQVTRPMPTGCIATGAITAVGAVQALIDEALGVSAPAHDLNADGSVGIADVQIMADWVLGLGCSASQ